MKPSVGPTAPADGTSTWVVEVHILSGSRAGQRVRFLDPELLRFGRHPAAEVAFSRTEDLSVSHHHCELRREQGAFLLYDEGSTNGTLLRPRGEAVRRMLLTAETEIELGRGGPRCRILISPAQATGHESTRLMASATTQPMPAVAGPGEQAGGQGAGQGTGPGDQGGGPDDPGAGQGAGAAVPAGAGMAVPPTPQTPGHNGRLDGDLLGQAGQIGQAMMAGMPQTPGPGRPVGSASRPGQRPAAAEEHGEETTFGKYVLIGRVGSGGMAELYLARQLGLGGFDREVVLKLIRPELYDVPDVASMLLDEARIISEINHPNVVQVYEVGEEQGVLYIAMEYLRGVTLLQLAVKAQQQGELLPPDLVAALLMQACAGLHAAHELHDRSGQPRNVVHRDVSPPNLMCTPEGVVKVIDFGVARADGRLAGTDVGQLKGKLGYMSPEQVLELPVDRRSDVFSLAVVMFELCSGRRLFLRDSDTATLMAASRAEAPPLRRFCPAASPLLEHVVQTALAVDRAVRPQTAAALGEELQAVVEEAGGRFSSSGQIVRYLQGRGLSLLGSGPRPVGPRLPSFLPAPRGIGISQDGGGGAVAGEAAGAVAAVAVAPAVVQPGAVVGPVAGVGPAAVVVPPVAIASLAAAVGATPAVVAPPSGAWTAVSLVQIPPGHTVHASGPVGQPVALEVLMLDTGRDREPVRLPMCAVPGLLPAPLLVSLRTSSLTLEIARGEAPRDERPPAIYHDAHVPATRRDPCILSPGDQGSLDVGHRKTRVQKISYLSVAPPQAAEAVPVDSAQRSAAPSIDGAAPFIEVPALGLRLLLPGTPQQVLVLHTVDARTGVTHANCVAVY